MIIIMSESGSPLHWLDYIIFAVLLGSSLVIGIIPRFTGSRQKSTKDYLLGNRYGTLMKEIGMKAFDIMKKGLIK